MGKKVSLPLQCRWLKATSFLLMCSDRQWKVRQRAEKAGHWRELGRTASRSTWRPGNLRSTSLSSTSCHGSMPRGPTKQFKIWTFISHFYDINLITSPKSLKTKRKNSQQTQIKPFSKKWIHSYFANRLLKQRACKADRSYAAVHRRFPLLFLWERKQREISGTWLALLLHEAILLLFTTVPQALNHNGCHWKYLSRCFYTSIFSLQSGQTHLTLCRGTLQNLSWHSEGILTEVQNIFSLIC